jgi:hypothetical protein
LVTPSAVVVETLRWSHVYERLFNFYLPSYGFNPLPTFDDFAGAPDNLEPSALELDDPRPILTNSDGTLEGIARRRVYHAVNFDVSSEADDKLILRSAFSALADHLRQSIHRWYNDLQVPLRSAGFTAQDLRDKAEQHRQRLSS